MGAICHAFNILFTYTQRINRAYIMYTYMYLSISYVYPYMNSAIYILYKYALEEVSVCHPLYIIMCMVLALIFSHRHTRTNNATNTTLLKHPTNHDQTTTVRVEPFLVYILQLIITSLSLSLIHTTTRYTHKKKQKNKKYRIHKQETNQPRN